MFNNMPVTFHGGPVLLNATKMPQKMSRQELDKELSAKLKEKNKSDAIIYELELHQLELEVQNRELIRSYQELETISQKYIDLYEYAPVGYISIDEKGLIVELNQTASKLLKKEKLLLIGKALSRWVARDYKPLLMHHFDSCLKSEDSSKKVCEVDLFNPGDFRTSVEVHSQKCFDAQKKKYFISMTLIDITEKKKILLSESRLREMSDEKDLREKFVSTLSHDLRAPLTSSKLCAQMMESEKVTKDNKERLQGILINELERADRMIRELLDANKIEGGKNLPLIKKKCDLSHIYKRCVEKHNLLHENRIKLETNVNLTGFWCRDAIERIIENLLSNALKYGEENTPISMKVEDLGKHVKICIHNFGKKIEDIDQKKIFQAFHRTDEAKNSQATGWGLGLNLVNLLVKRHEGEIKVISYEGDGTSFIVTLPKNSLDK